MLIIRKPQMDTLARERRVRLEEALFRHIQKHAAGGHPHAAEGLTDRGSDFPFYPDLGWLRASLQN